MAKVSPGKEEGHTATWADRTHSGLGESGTYYPRTDCSGEEGSHLEVFNPKSSVTLPRFYVGMRNRNELLGLVMGQGKFYVKCA